MKSNDEDFTNTFAASSQNEWQLSRKIDSISKEELWSMLVADTENTLRLLSRHAKGLRKLEDALSAKSWEQAQPILEVLRVLNTSESERLLQGYVSDKLHSDSSQVVVGVVITLIGVGGIAWFIANYRVVVSSGMNPLLMLWLPALLMLALPFGLFVSVVGLVNRISNQERERYRRYRQK